MIIFDVYLAHILLVTYATTVNFGLMWLINKNDRGEL